MRNFSSIFKKAWGLVMLLSFIATFASNAQDVAEGRTIFKSKCSSCHALDRDAIGPALQKIVPTKSEEFLLKWIKNAPAFIASGNAEAVEASKFNAVMF